MFSAQHQAKLKAGVVSLRHQRQISEVSRLTPLLLDNLRHVVQLSIEKGASSWLSMLHIEEHGFALHKGAFRDALCLQYGWLPSGLSAKCVCGHAWLYC